MQVEMNKLTKAEEEIMLILWELGESTVRDVIKKLDDPNTPYTTVATVIRILEKKEFVAHKAIGNTYVYKPSVARADYMNQSLNGLLNKYFEGSFSNLASFFASENDISLKDLSEMMEDIREEKRIEKEEGDGESEGEDHSRQ